MPSPIDIPIEFEYEGIWFEGTFTSTGDYRCWDLILYGYSYGMLVKYSSGWQWCSNGKPPMFLEDYMEKYFIELVEKHLKEIEAYLQ